MVTLISAARAAFFTKSSAPILISALFYCARAPFAQLLGTPLHVTIKDGRHLKVNLKLVSTLFDFCLILQIILIKLTGKYSLIVADLGDIRFVRNLCEMSFYRHVLHWSRSRLKDVMRCDQLFLTGERQKSTKSLHI